MHTKKTFGVVLLCVVASLEVGLSAAEPASEFRERVRSVAATSSDEGTLSYDIGCPGELFLERGPSPRIASDEKIADEIHTVTGDHKAVTIYVGALNLDTAGFVAVGKSIKKLDDLIAANADPECKVKIVILAVVSPKRPTPAKGKAAASKSTESK